MCRLLVQSNYLDDGQRVCNDLILSNGGDGDGFIHSPNTVIESDMIKTIEHNINGINVKKIFYSLPLTQTKHKYAILKEFVNVYNTVKGAWYFYHTRVSSTDEVNIVNTHPWLCDKEQRYLVQQNGHESRISMIHDNLADYKVITIMIQNVNKEVVKTFLFSLEFSNFFIVDTKEKEFIILSNKSSDPLWVHTINPNRFIIASEKVSKDMKKFEGYIEGKIHDDSLEITNQFKLKRPKYIEWTPSPDWFKGGDNI